MIVKRSQNEKFGQHRQKEYLMLVPRLLRVASNNVVISIGAITRNAHSYAQTVRKQGNWESVFLPHLQRHIAIKKFKDNLSKAVDDDHLPLDGSLELEALERLIEKTSGSKKIGNKSVREIYNLILQRRIKDDDIYEVIANISQNSVINVSVPKKLNVKQSAGGLKGNLEPFFRIHPEGESHLSNALDTIQDHEQPNLPKHQSFEAYGVPSTTKAGPCEEAPKTNIDIKSLRKYLQRAEKEEKQRRQYVWEKQKQYDWEERFSSSLKLSPGRLFFADDKIVTKRRSRPNITKAFFDETSVPSSQIDNAPKELLIYNLSAKSQQILSSDKESSIFNINYKDLFEVINGSGYLPEEILSTINDFETAGWKLLGDLYGNSGSLVFQRVVNTKRKQAGKWTQKHNIFWALMITLTGAATFRFFNKNSLKE